MRNINGGCQQRLVAVRGRASTPPPPNSQEADLLPLFAEMTLPLPFPLNPYQIRMRKRGPQACVAYAVSTARGASRPTAVWQLPERALMPGREYASASASSSLADSETE